MTLSSHIPVQAKAPPAARAGFPTRSAVQPDIPAGDRSKRQRDASGLWSGAGRWIDLPLRDAGFQPPTIPGQSTTPYYSERILKFLLWQRGGWQVYVGGPAEIGDHLRRCYSPAGSARFDYHFMGEEIYQKPFTIMHLQAGGGAAGE